MKSRLQRLANRQEPLRRCAAALLLFLFVTDFGFHFASSFFADPEPEGSVLLRSWDGRLGNPEESSGCGIPGHSGSPFHHHHFPAVVTQAHLAAALAILKWAPPTAVTEAVYTALVPSLGRSPPIAF